MRTITVIICIVALMYSTSFAPIVEHKAIHSITHYVADTDDNLLILIDIDYTLVQPQGWVGSIPWFEYMIGQKVAQGISHQQATVELLDLGVKIHPFTSIKLIEQDTAVVIQNLQQKNIIVVALTARPPESAALTIKQLNALGIDFSLSGFNVHTLTTPQDPFLYHQGIIFCKNHDKGKVLVEILTRLKLSPSRIISIDDALKHLVNEEKALQEHDSTIQFLGIRYSYLDAMASLFDAKQSELELKEILNELESKEAEILQKFIS
jgi:hypothetical protein